MTRDEAFEVWAGDEPDPFGPMEREWKQQVLRAWRAAWAAATERAARAVLALDPRPANHPPDCICLHCQDATACERLVAAIRGEG